MKKLLVLLFAAFLHSPNVSAQNIAPYGVKIAATDSIVTRKMLILDKDGGNLSDKMLAPESKQAKVQSQQLMTTLKALEADTLEVGGGMYLLNNNLLEVKVNNLQWANLTSKSGFANELQSISQSVYSKFNDDFDFIIYTLNTPLAESIMNNLQFYGINIEISNDIQGIGKTVNNSESKLKSVMFFPFYNALLIGPTLHELSHNWATFILNRYSTDNTPIDDIPEIARHWGISNAGGQLGGFKYIRVVEENCDGIKGKTLYQASMHPDKIADGSFQYPGFGLNANGGNSIPYSDIELYLMGMKSAQELRNNNFHLDLYSGNSIEGVNFNEGYFYSTTKTSFTIDDIIAKYGPRIPDFSASQKHFKILTVALTPDTAAQSYCTMIAQSTGWFAGDVIDSSYPGLYNFRQATNNSGSVEIGEIQNSFKYKDVPTLNSLATSQGTLSPLFDPYVFDYTLNVDASVESIDITGTTDIVDATVSGNATALSLQLNNHTDTTISVTNKNGIRQEYGISIIRGNIPPVSFTYQITKDAVGHAFYTVIGLKAGEFVVVDWGDGTKRDTIREIGLYQQIPAYGITVPGEPIPHTYNTAGSYQVSFFGKDELFCPLITLWTNIENNGTVSHHKGIYITSVNVKSATLLSSLIVDNKWPNFRTYSYYMTNLDVSQNKQLFWLQCDANKIPELNVSNNPKLKYLFCVSNQLTHLNLKNNPELKNLSCGSNSITELDVSYNTNLEELECGFTNLKSIDISNNTKLKYFACDQSRLGEIDFKNNILLEWLILDKNLLTNLDLKNNKVLRSLGCSSNQLKFLDVSNHPELNFLSCYENKLRWLDVSNDPKLEVISCMDNSLPLSCLYKICQQKKYLSLTIATQTLPDSTVNIQTPIALDTVFYGLNTVFKSFGSLGVDYLLANGEITFLNPGEYQVTISNPAIPAFQIVESIVSQRFKVKNEIESDINNINASDVHLYPNPVKDDLFIQTDHAIERIEIYNQIGTQIFTNEGATDKLDLLTLTNGVYFVKIFIDNMSITKKFVKQ
ncbi:MAG: T9SS type A sorting domain-containing protein [Methylococcaceae bacterium]|nr:T9SS type A sorting domain-containing protein [Prolixibacteraceae bacterium]